MIYYNAQAKFLLLAILFFGTATEIFAAEGDLDLSFDDDGIVITDNGSNEESIRDLAVQPDSKIIAVGNGFVGSPSTHRTVIVRYNTNGSIDSMFGSGGKVIIQSVFPYKLALQPNGKIVLVGTKGLSTTGATTNSDFYVARLNADGSFDTTFNGTGEINLDLRGTSDNAASVKIQPDGKIVVGGNSQRSSSDTRSDFTIVRFNADGSLDASFDGDGKVFTMIPPTAESASIDDLDVQTDGKILAAGSVSIVDTPGDDPDNIFAVARYNTDGSLDTTFDGDGVANPRFLPPSGNGTTSRSFPTNIFAQSDGKTLVVGVASTCCSPFPLSRGALARFNADGSLDTTFDGDGTALIIFSDGFGVRDAALQPDNKIVIVGNRGIIKRVDASVVRLNADASLDLTFSGDGRSVIESPPNTSANAVALQPDGKIIIGGRFPPNSNTGGSDFLLARFEARSCRTATCSGERQKVADFDGDGKTDLSVFRNGTWFVNPSGANNPNSFYGVQFGLTTDKLTPADYDGDGKTDIAVWRENVNGSLGYFYILQSSTNTARTVQFGQTGDDPRVVGDWDGDGKADPAVYRSGGTAGAQSFFYYRPSSQPLIDFVTVRWGTAGDEAVHGDFDGDGRVDAAVFRASDGIWYVLQSSNAQPRYERWGLALDRRVAGDFDGDGKTDFAIFRDGLWAVLQSSNNQPRYVTWGLSSDRLVAGDYDGDGRTDFAVWRAGVYYILQNSNSQTVYRSFGASNDVPVASAFIR